jgi:acetate kinase
VYTLQKIIGAYLSQCDSLDALIFTGGIGENAGLIREKTLSSIKHLGFNIDSTLNYQSSAENCRAISMHGKLILVINGDEESLMAQKVAEQIVLKKVRHSE